MPITWSSHCFKELQQLRAVCAETLVDAVDSAYLFPQHALELVGKERLQLELC